MLQAARGKGQQVLGDTPGFGHLRAADAYTHGVGNAFAGRPIGEVAVAEIPGQGMAGRRLGAHGMDGDHTPDILLDAVVLGREALIGQPRFPFVEMEQACQPATGIPELSDADIAEVLHGVTPVPPFPVHHHADRVTAEHEIHRAGIALDQGQAGYAPGGEAPQPLGAIAEQGVGVA